MKDELYELKIKMLPVAALKLRASNPRKHSRRQIRQIADSICRFGFNNPILIDTNGRIIAGHGRHKAAKLLGLTEVPTIRRDHMSEAEIRAYVIADNRLAENAGWDEDLLRTELQYLDELEGDFDLTITGFEMGEIDVLLDSVGSDEPDEADQLPELDESQPAVTRRGDLWALGPHFLLCADATEEASLATVMSESLADMSFTDPPYNVPIDGHVCGLGAIRHAEFAMASGEMSEAEFTAFLETVLGLAAAYSRPGSVHFIFMDWRHFYELLTAGREVYSSFISLCVWCKDNGGMGSLYRSRHELVGVFKHGTAPHINNVQLGRFGRYRTNIWDYPGVNTFRDGRLDDLAMHPTVKPVALVADAILDCSNRGDTVLDCFGGSGTTLIAAERAGRHARLIEIDPGYVDVCVKRYERLTGQCARHGQTGLTFGEMADRRCEDVTPRTPAR